jgi:acylphosphatase
VTRRRIVVTGRVQGVWFRESTRQAAERHGVAGWARNRPDGSVEIVVEGLEQAVEALVRYCSTGPRDARVEKIQVTPEQPEGLVGFVVRR